MRTADHLLILGRQARAASRLEAARSFFLEALTLSRRDGKPISLIESLKGLGQIARDVGDLESARRHYEEAAKACESAGDTLLLAHTVRHVGDILLQQGQVPLAREACRRALQIYRSNPDASPLDLANTLRSAAMVAEIIDGLAVSQPMWEEARGLYATLGVSAGVEECNMHIGSSSR